MNTETKGNCKHCDEATMPYSTLLRHLWESHPVRYEEVFQRIDTKAKPEPEYETMPYKDYIAKLWAEFVPDDDCDY